jgi:hypothetical protein
MNPFAKIYHFFRRLRYPWEYYTKEDIDYARSEAKRLMNYFHDFDEKHNAKKQK